MWAGPAPDSWGCAFSFLPLLKNLAANPNWRLGNENSTTSKPKPKVRSGVIFHLSWHLLECPLLPACWPLLWEVAEYTPMSHLLSPQPGLPFTTQNRGPKKVAAAASWEGSRLWLCLHVDYFLNPRKQGCFLQQCAAVGLLI